MRRVYLNVLASIFPQAVNIVSNLILPGLIILQFGSELNGLVSTTKSVISCITLVGAGIASAVTQSLYKPVAENNPAEVKGMLHAANSMFRRYGFIYCCITVICAACYPMILDTEVEPALIVALLIVMSLSGASEFFAIGRCRSLLYAHQAVYICSIVQAVSLLIGLALALVMLKINASIVFVQLAISGTYVLRGLFLTALIRKKYPQYKGYMKEPPIRSATAKRKDALIHQLSGLAITASQTIILSSFVGLEAASVYAVYNIVYSGLQSICSNVNTALMPYLGRYYALGEIRKLRAAFSCLELVFFDAVLVIYATAVYTIVLFVSLYTAGADMEYANYAFAVIFAFGSASYVLKLPGTSLYNAAGQFKETRTRAITEALVCIGVSLAATVFVGLYGVVIGYTVAVGWRCFDTVFYSSKHVLQASCKNSLKRLSLVYCVVAFAAFMGWLTPFSADGYVGWLGTASLAVLFYVAIAVLLNLIFDRSEFLRLFKRLFSRASR